ncbi:ATP-binding protein [Pectinatus frisingensis]|uniref:ATP-binding protein n=1 Tax=Pectinatus frisingensis TaxID=865 RepID=UPI003D807453
MQTGKLETKMKRYLRSDILVIDEVGHMQLDRQAAEILFCLVCLRYENGSIILTSNKFFTNWGELLSDAVIATALLDCLLHHAHVINIRGESYRLKDRAKAGFKTRHRSFSSWRYPDRRWVIFQLAIRSILFRP